MPGIRPFDTYHRLPDSRACGVIQKLRQARIDMGISQQSLADRLETMQNQISEWECGRKRPSLFTLLRWVDALGYQLTLEDK